jgi:hypothetical protein
MKPIIEAQELARRFNEDEAVRRSYEHKRELRRLLGSRTPLPGCRCTAIGMRGRSGR